MLSGKNYSVLSQPGRGPGPENYTQILQLYKELTSRRKVRFRQTFFKLTYIRNVLYKEVMLTDPMTPLDGFLAPQSWEI